MIFDHIGYYFYPDNVWLRAVSTSAPLWFFFVGYANSRNLKAPLWAGAFILLLAAFIAGKTIFPLSILFSIIIARLVLDGIMRMFFKSREHTICITLFLLVVTLPTWLMWEYGAVGILISMWAWMLRHQGEDVKIKQTLSWFSILVMAVFIIMHALVYSFSVGQLYVFTVASSAAFALAYLFKVQEYPVLTEQLPAFVVAGLKGMGRYSLYIYVGHVLLFLFIVQQLDPERFIFLQWSLF